MNKRLQIGHGTEGWIVPEPPKNKKNKSVGIIGAGPAGMAAAQQLARIGYEIHLYDREPKIGGLIDAYGIPDFKMEKALYRLASATAGSRRCNI